jgi:hypothetical protein
MKLHCDNCEKECPPFEEAVKQGWYISSKSVSGIPWDMLCPDCIKKPHYTTPNMQNKKQTIKPILVRKFYTSSIYENEEDYIDEKDKYLIDIAEKLNETIKVLNLISPIITKSKNKKV